jgi:hypothetical protein
MGKGVCSFAILLLLIGIVAPVTGQAVVRSFEAPGPESRGLAWDGQFLWCVDAEVDSIFKIDPADGTILTAHYFYVNYGYGGLTWGQNGTLWLANGSTIYRISSETGQIEYNMSCPGGG